MPHLHPATVIHPDSRIRRNGWRRLAIVLATLGSAAAGGSATTAAAEELDKILARPMTTGSVALLWEHITAPAAHERLREALKDSRPDVRAVAARVAHNSKVQALLPDLRAALDTETDAGAATELVRGVILMGGPASYANAVAVATRLRGGVPQAVAETLARLGSRALLAHFEAVASAGLPTSVLAKAVAAVTKGDDAARVALLRTPFVVKNRPVLESLLTTFRADGTAVPPDLLMTWLQGEDDLRMAAIWHIVHTTARSRQAAISSEVLTALAPRLDATKTDITWEALGLELIARMTGRPASARSWATLKMAGPAATEVFSTLLAIEALTDAERRDLSQVLYGNRSAFVGREIQRVSAATPKAPLPVVLSAPPLLGSLWRDLYDITRCKPRLGRVAFAEMAYQPDGRPRQMRLETADLPSGCQAMVRALFTLSLPLLTEPVPATYSEIAAIPFTETTIACAREQSLEWTMTAESADTPPGEQQSERSIKPPKRIRNLQPMYPESARKDRVHGMVLIETVISPTGCIATGRVTRGVDTRLDVEALIAVMNWRYSPTLLDNKPVPVLMTVLVNFELPE